MYKKKTTPKKKTSNGGGKKATAKKTKTAAQKKAIKAKRASEVDRILSTIGSPSKSKLTAAQRAKKKRVINSYVNANKRR